jgi:hypothetical protein
VRIYVVILTIQFVANLTDSLTTFAMRNRSKDLFPFR